MYISSLIRAIIALHDLLNNKLKYKNLDDILDGESGLESKKDKEEKGKPSESGKASEESKNVVTDKK